MPKALLIAEKPSLMREIEDVYNKIKSKLPYEITFTSQRGHLVTLKTPDEIDPEQKKWEWSTIPFHPEKHGGWQYKVIEDEKKGSYLTSKERFEAIKEELLSGKYDFVINAGDAEQEGELLIRLVLNEAGNTLPVKRFWTNALTESAITDALNNLLDDDHDPMLLNLYSAALARQHSDYRFGMNLSRASTLKMGARVAVGRVKTPILAIVCKREDEIEHFVPKTKYGVSAEFDKGYEGSLFAEGSTEEESDEDEEKRGIIWFENKEDAENLIKTLPSTGIIDSVESKKEETYAPKLFNLSSLQIAAGKMGLRANEVLETIQSLYERKILSYPRTDCEYLSSTEDYESILDAIKDVPCVAEYVKSITPKDIERVKKTKKWVNDKALEESGHSALRPTEETPDLTEMTPIEELLYEMIVKRFVAIFLPPLIQEKKTVITDVGGKTFKSNGKTIISKGYTEILEIASKDSILPELHKGDPVVVSKFDIPTQTSVCPKRYTDGELVGACEHPMKFVSDSSLKALGKDLAIGRPSTRGAIIDQLIAVDKYMERFIDGKVERIRPTEAGRGIIANLGGLDICRVDLTGHWEQKLIDVRAGKLPLTDLETEMISHVDNLVKDIKDMTLAVSIKSTKGSFAPLCTCPVCGKDVLEGTKSYFCVGYKDTSCNISIWKDILGAKITPTDAKKLFKGDEITKKLKKDSKTWEQKLKFNTSTNKLEFVKAPVAESKLSCPNCGKKLIDKEKLLSCSCGFALWKTMASKTLSDKDIESLILDGRTTTIKGFTSKAGKKFDAPLIMDKATGKVSFDFK